MLELNLRKVDAMNFCNKLSKFKSNFDIHNKRMVIDGKSIIGLYALDYSSPIYMECILSGNENLDYIKENLKEYLKND